MPIEEPVGEMPQTFVLYQNYPNPFNPTTTIKFSIPNTNVIARNGVLSSSKYGETTQSQQSSTIGETATSLQVGTRSGNVSLIVYNSLGQQIAELITKPLTSGNYEVKFDGTNLPSGIYFYRLQSGDFVDVKKMILLK